MRLSQGSGAPPVSSSAPDRGTGRFPCRVPEAHASSPVGSCPRPRWVLRLGRGRVLAGEHGLLLWAISARAVRGGGSASLTGDAGEGGRDSVSWTIQAAAAGASASSASSFPSTSALRLARGSSAERAPRWKRSSSSKTRPGPERVSLPSGDEAAVTSWEVLGGEGTRSSCATRTPWPAGTETTGGCRLGVPRSHPGTRLSSSCWSRGMLRT
mmetsp:Transcript_15639/g.45730  ORF Transcript_15639/g.45730 Transcript_15639/m.45730 type:complete len:212 (-) Transcript_15639:509-1144(-)